MKRNFTASAMKWVMPISLMGPMLARLGPSRSCIMADCRRSSQVRMDARGIKNPRIMKAIFAKAAMMTKPSVP